MGEDAACFSVILQSLIEFLLCETNKKSNEIPALEEFTSWGWLQIGKEIITVPCDMYYDGKYTRCCNTPEKKAWLDNPCQENTTTQFIFSGRELIGMDLVVKWIN